MDFSCRLDYVTSYRVVQNKLHKVFNLINFQIFAVEWLRLHQIFPRGLLSANQRKIYVNVNNLVRSKHTASANKCP